MLLEGSFMAEEKMDFTGHFINQIKAKIAALQAVLASVESASAVGALGPVEGIESSPQITANGRSELLGMPTDLPQGVFMGKSVPACIELYLSAVKKKKTNKEIADALREGGVESNSKLDNTVNGALFKLKNEGVVLRFKDGWGLSSWYPAHIRAVSPAASTAKKSKNESTAAGAPVSASLEPKRKARDIILELLRTKPEREYHLAEISEGTSLGIKFVRLVLGQLLKAGLVRMTAPGMYVIQRPQLVAAGD
jgi:predicted transcriptional regulator